jgi:hypothetical protein
MSSVEQLKVKKHDKLFLVHRLWHVRELNTLPVPWTQTRAETPGISLARLRDIRTLLDFYIAQLRNSRYDSTFSVVILEHAFASSC